MIKHVNFTGRRRIARGCVDVVVYDDTPRRFDATIDLAETRMPADAKLYLEAMSAGSSVIQRFAFGTVQSPAPPENRILDEVGGDRVFFTLKVVDESELAGRILGLAENIRPKDSDKTTDTGRRGILPILPQPLGQELWRVDLGEHEVCLLVNEDVPNIKDRTRWDPLFQAAIYPAVVRIIVTEALERGASEDDEDQDSWPSRWLRFARSIHPERTPPPTDESPEAREDWIDEVVAEFASRHNLTDQFRRRLAQFEGEEP
jgi:hypothetical protein